MIPTEGLMGKTHGPFSLGTYPDVPLYQRRAGKLVVPNNQGQPGEDARATRPKIAHKLERDNAGPTTSIRLVAQQVHSRRKILRSCCLNFTRHSRICTPQAL